MKQLLLILALFFSACTTTIPPIQEYRVTSKVATDQESESSCKEYALKVSQVFGNSFTKSTDMHYLLGEYKELSFTQSAWSDTLAKLLTSEIVRTLSQAGIYKNVESYRSRSGADFILETRVNEFLQHFSEDEHKSYVVVDMTMTLIDIKSFKVIQTKRFYKRLDAQEADAQSGVKALNSAFAAVLKESVAWLKSSCI